MISIVKRNALLGFSLLLPSLVLAAQMPLATAKDSDKEEVALEADLSNLCPTRTAVPTKEKEVKSFVGSYWLL